MSLPERRRAPLHRLSIRRKSIQFLLVLMMLIPVAIVVIVAGNCTHRNIQDALAEDFRALPGPEESTLSDGATPRTDRAISTARIWIVALGILLLLLALFMLYRQITLGLRVVDIELWIRRMGAGDLEYKIEPTGHDEITETTVALEQLRQSSIQAMQLNLVQKLSEGLQKKNEELERVLAELQQAQEQVILRQKLVELGELTAGIAHEIRNPLNFVSNFTQASEELLEELGEAIDETIQDPDDDKRRLVAEISQDITDNLERIRSHGDRANRIIRNMLMIGRGGGDFEPVDVHNMLKENAMLAYHSVRVTDQSFQLDLQTDFDPNVGELSLVSEDMGRVIINMVTNACYATNEKGRSIEADSGSFMPTIRLRTERKEDSIEIRIRDNGTGIPPDLMEKIFNPFFTTKPTDKGTGLGLSLSNDIIRRHGGSISVQSEPGEYTEMIISLPSPQSLPPTGQ